MARASTRNSMIAELQKEYQELSSSSVSITKASSSPDLQNSSTFLKPPLPSVSKSTKLFHSKSSTITNCLSSSKELLNNTKPLVSKNTPADDDGSTPNKASLIPQFARSRNGIKECMRKSKAAREEQTEETERKEKLDQLHQRQKESIPKKAELAKLQTQREEQEDKSHAVLKLEASKIKELFDFQQDLGGEEKEVMMSSTQLTGPPEIHLQLKLQEIAKVKNEEIRKLRDIEQAEEEVKRMRRARKEKQVLLEQQLLRIEQETVIEKERLQKEFEQKKEQVDTSERMDPECNWPKKVLSKAAQMDQDDAACGIQPKEASIRAETPLQLRLRRMIESFVDSPAIKKRWEVIQKDFLEYSKYKLTSGVGRTHRDDIVNGFRQHYKKYDTAPSSIIEMAFQDWYDKNIQEEITEDGIYTGIQLNHRHAHIQVDTVFAEEEEEKKEGKDTDLVPETEEEEKTTEKLNHRHAHILVETVTVEEEEEDVDLLTAKTATGVTEEEEKTPEKMVNEKLLTMIDWKEIQKEFLDYSNWKLLPGGQTHKNDIIKSFRQHYIKYDTEQKCPSSIIGMAIQDWYNDKIGGKIENEMYAGIILNPKYAQYRGSKKESNSTKHLANKIPDENRAEGATIAEEACLAKEEAEMKAAEAELAAAEADFAAQKKNAKKSSMKDGRGGSQKSSGSICSLGTISSIKSESKFGKPLGQDSLDSMESEHILRKWKNFRANSGKDSRESSQTSFISSLGSSMGSGCSYEMAITAPTKHVNLKQRTSTKKGVASTAAQLLSPNKIFKVFVKKSGDKKRQTDPSPPPFESKAWDGYGSGQGLQVNMTGELGVPQTKRRDRIDSQRSLGMSDEDALYCKISETSLANRGLSDSQTSFLSDLSLSEDEVYTENLQMAASIRASPVNLRQAPESSRSIGSDPSLRSAPAMRGREATSGQNCYQRRNSRGRASASPMKQPWNSHPACPNSPRSLCSDRSLRSAPLIKSGEGSAEANPNPRSKSRGRATVSPIGTRKSWHSKAPARGGRRAGL